MTHTTEQLRALCDAATPGPWTGPFMLGHKRPWVLWDDHGDGKFVAETHSFRGVDDAAFIVAARAAVPELLDEVEELRRSMVPLDVYQASIVELNSAIEETEKLRASRETYLTELHRVEDSRDTALRQRDALVRSVKTVFEYPLGAGVPETMDNIERAVLRAMRRALGEPDGH